MFKHIIARTPARSLVDGLTSSHLGKPDYAKALEQHNAYIRALQTCDVDITLLPPDERFPDSVFVEDPVLCTSRCAIITRPGAESRRGETEIIEETVQRFYPGKVERIEAPGTVEAGDIMMVGDHFYIGESARTNAEGARQMIAILEKHGLSGSVVRLEKVLHLNLNHAAADRPAASRRRTPAQAPPAPGATYRMQFRRCHMADSDKGKLGLPALTALVVGGIIGSGIFSLPQNMAEGAGAGAILIAWAITFVGMLTLTRIFQWLSTTRPELDDGVYGYAREGFGEYLGFNAAWGYWISAWVGNAGYLVVLFSALGSFGALAFFGDGTTWPALLGELTVLWLMHAFVLHGVHNAAITNAIVTLAKVVPIALFILCVALAFRIETFHLDFWGSPALGSVTRQVETTMLYTVWVFLGIESATVYASHARHAADVSRATLLGFVVTLLLLVCVSVLSLGVVPQHELAQMKNPSMAQVMAAAVGPWGATLINVGLIVSVGGALLAWTMLAVEMLYLASRGPTHTAPALFGRTNAVETPAPALWLTSTLISALLLVAFLNASGYNALIQLATSMALIPYLLCAGFCLKLVARRPHSGAMLALALLGTLYGVWLIYAAGLKYLLLSMILYAPGLGFFLHARRQRGLPAFGNRAEGSVAALVLVLALAALWMIGSGRLSL